jgi:hypothetical protein
MRPKYDAKFCVMEKQAFWRNENACCTIVCWHQGKPLHTLFGDSNAERFLTEQAQSLKEKDWNLCK